MNFAEYTKEVERTVAGLKSDFDNQLHMSIGISTEANEILDAYKKSFAYSRDLDVVNVGEEIGDLMWYIANLTRMLNLNFDDILEVNLLKLRQRYPDKFDPEKATNRDLAMERKILEELGFSDKSNSS